MFVIKKEDTSLPVKVWLAQEQDLEQGCLEQAFNLSSLPFISSWVALMPDTHRGMGVPIGSVIAGADTVIPNAVGVDIGCGMAFTATDIPTQLLKETLCEQGNLIQAMVEDVLRNVPTGFKRHKHPQPSWTLNRAWDELDKYEDQPQLLGQLEAGCYQIGTLGGGNHFIEFQEDDDGKLCIMLHSGSRNFGKQVCDYFHQSARELNAGWNSTVPDYWRLAYLPVDTPQGQGYLNWMNLALDFAYENRTRMMLAVKAILEKWIGKYTDLSIGYTDEINCHHNYAALETHFGKEVYVHRKGAVRADKGQRVVIPGAMGSFSYVAEGLGCEESFRSCSHGAGRLYSRKGALAQFTKEQVLSDLSAQQVVLGKRSKKDVADESRFAYKNIDQVMENQKDLVRPVKQLKTLGVVKG